jgi:hypothetical protein
MAIAWARAVLSVEEVECPRVWFARGLHLRLPAVPEGNGFSGRRVEGGAWIDNADRAAALTIAQ